MAYANGGAQLGGFRRQLGATPQPATPGDEVTVGGDVSMGPPITIRADDTGATWTVSDAAGTGWVGLAPPYGPITRGAVRGLAAGPYLIGRVSGASKYAAGERGTTVIGNAARLAAEAQARIDAPLADPMVQQLVRSAVDPNSSGYNATINQKYFDQFAAEATRQRNAGLITDAQLAHALTLRDDPVAAQQKAFWIPPGASVPLVLQGGAVTDTGSIHPDALTPEEQANLARVLAYTAEKRGTSYAEEAARAADKLRAANPGETFAGVEKFAAGIEAGELVQLTAKEASNATFTVDERPLDQQQADPAGIGVNSILYDLQPGGRSGMPSGGDSAGPALQPVAGMTTQELVKWLLLGGGVSMLAFMSKGRR